MKFAVIGSAHGHIYEFIEDMLKSGGEFVGVYEDNTNTAAKISQAFSVPLFTDLNELLNCSIEIVGTSAVNSQKIDVIERCSEKGIHVIADKPIVVNKTDFKRLEKVSKDDKIQIGLMLTMRFMPEVYTVKKIIEEGIIGEVINIEILNPHCLRPKSRPEWFFDKEKNGDLVVDLMVHSIDLFNWFTEGSVVDYKGVIHKKILKERETFYDSASFFVQGSSGISGYFRTDWHIPSTHWTWGDIRILCVGTEGSLEARVSGDPVTREKAIVLYREGEETKRIPFENCSGSVTKDLLSRIKGEEHLISQENVLEATRLSIEFSDSADIIVKNLQ